MLRVGYWGSFAAALLLTGCDFSLSQNQLNYSPAENHLLGNQTSAGSTAPVATPTSSPTSAGSGSLPPTSAPVSRPTPTPTPSPSTSSSTGSGGYPGGNGGPTSTPAPTPAMTASATLIPQGLSTFKGLPSNDILCVYLDGSTLYLGTDTGLAFSSDGGSTWTTKMATQGLGSNSVMQIYASGPTIYALTNNGLSISTNGGSSFTNNPNITGTALAVSGSSVYVLGTSLQISRDGGTTFTSITSPDLYSGGVGQVVIVGNTVYIAAFYGLFRSTDGGNTFSNILPFAAGTWANGVAVNGSTIDVVTNKNLMISTNGGTSFTTGPASDDMRTLADSGSLLVATTVSTGIGISTNGGTSFSYAGASSAGVETFNVNGVFVSGSTIYAATSAGLMISTNSRQSFSTVHSTNPICKPSGIAVSGSTLYLGGSCGVQATSDGGATFATYSVNSGSVSQIAVSGSTIYAATNQGLGVSTNGGSSFAMKTTAQGLPNNNVTSVFVSGSNVYVGNSFVGPTGYVAPTGSEGILSISTDGGNTFSSQGSANEGGVETLKIFSSGSDIFGAAVLSPQSDTAGKVTPAVSGLIRSLNSGSSFTSQSWSNVTVNAVSGSGSTVLMSTYSGLYISTDGGNTFAVRTTSQGLLSNFVYSAYVSGGNIYVGTIYGLSVSTDGGNTFGAVQINGLGNVALQINDFVISGNTLYALTNLGLVIGQL